jgi:hypothetical protein
VGKAKTKNPGDAKVTVALKDLDKVCHVCGQVKPDVHRRTYTTTNYQGSCGDSFCYASCDMSACKPITVQACGDCEIQKKDKP